MVKPIRLLGEQDYYALLTAAATLLERHSELLSHPSLDLSLAERERHEHDCHALLRLLPRKSRLMVEYDAAKIDTLGCPF